MRALGVDVQTFSVRPSTLAEQLSSTARLEAARTVNLLGHPPRVYAQAVYKFVSRHPVAFAREALHAVQAGPASLRSRVWQLFYLTESLLLRAELLERGLRHVHVHFANNGADIARRVVSLGRAADGEEAGWRWSFTMHGPTEFDDRIAFDLQAKTASASAVACISEFCQEQLLGPVPQEERPRTAVVRMSVDLNRYPGRSQERLGRKTDGRLRVLFVGRLVPEKGPDILVEAASLLARRGVALDLVIVGDGRLSELLRTEVEDKGLGDTVRLLGAVGQDDLPDWYRWADVFCLPSFAEGVPVVLMEAMSSELPVVTTPVAGIPELVDTTTGRLVPPGDATAVAEAIEEFGKDPELRAETGRRGRVVVGLGFAPEPNARALAGLLNLRTGATAPLIVNELS
jgi:colanic acid/amylovoran biosynthesis glycosyltransferase